MHFKPSRLLSFFLGTAGDGQIQPRELRWTNRGV
jgi:hypothetical protein